VYSADDEDAYSKFCVLFDTFSDRHINALGVLIEQPLTNWKKASEKPTAHFAGEKISCGSIGISQQFSVSYA